MQRTLLFKDLIFRLKEIVGDTATSEAEMIMETLTGCRRSDLYSTEPHQLTPEIIQQTDDVLRRRSQHEPLQYILGRAYFHDVLIRVTPDVLIPRPDTETLVEAVLANERQLERFFLDMGTGSGAIAVALMNKRPFWTGVCSDISPAALRIAGINLASVEVGRGFPVAGDRLTSFKPTARFDFIVSNPPYIAATEMTSLDASVRDFEPRHALCDGGDGLGFYRHLAVHAKAHLDRGSSLYCEIGYSQREQVLRIFADHEWRDMACIKDLAGRPRVITAIL